MLYLENDIFFIKGKCGAVLYDANRGELYHLNQEAKNLVSCCLQESYTAYSLEETLFLHDLRQKNILTGHFREKHTIADLRQLPKIDFVWIEVTTGCNLKCIHCYDESSSTGSITMPYTSFKHIIDELQENQIKKIQIIGGEPFCLGIKLKQYLDYCVGKFEYIEIFTNGTLITDSWVRYFLHNNIRIALSVYSYIPKEHDQITTVSGSWHKTNETIKHLKNAGIHYRVRNVIIKDLKQGEKCTELYTLSQKRDIVRIVGRANIGLLDRDLLSRKIITEESFKSQIKKCDVIRNISGHGCFSRRLYFSADSEVYPCVMERRISHGNISNCHLSELIKQNIISFNKDKINECSECEFRYFCFDCRPDSNGNDINDKPWYCTYSPLEGKWQDKTEFIDKILSV